MAQLSGQQVVPEGSNRVIGKDAQRINIAVGYTVAQLVKTTLGPRGMDKMLVSELGDVTITNDGATILKEMNIEHPAGKMMVEIAKTQDSEVGDGTTTSVVIAGELLRKASELLDNDIHASTIVNGYKLATKRALAELKEVGEPIKVTDKDKLEKIASVAMGSKTVGVGSGKDVLSKLVVEAVMQVAQQHGDSVVIDKDYIKLEKKKGGDVLQTQLVKGVLVDKEIVHPGMPKELKKAKIALLDVALEIEKTEVDARINISSPEQMSAFLEQEEKMLKTMVDKVVKSGANVLFCQKGIDDVAQHYLAKAEILTCRRVKKSDMEKLARATSGRVVTTLDDLSAKDLGAAGSVQEKKIAGEHMVFVEECKDPKAVTLLVRGSTDHIVDEAERAVVDAIGATSSAIEEGSYVTGGGSVEMELATRLRKYAVEVGGREQLAIQAYADALEVIPKTLTESTGLDAIDTLVDLRAKHEKKEGKYFGIDIYGLKVGDMKALNVIEPSKVKKQALQSASEVAEMILRIDDMIAARGRPMPQGGPGGMPGMGGME